MRIIASLMLAACVLLSCTSPGGGHDLNDSWQEIADGITYTVRGGAREAVRYHLVRIDLLQENLVLRAYPDSTTPVSLKDGEPVFKGKKTRAFAKAAGCVVAINTGVYVRRAFGKRALRGTHVFEGAEYGFPVRRFAALRLSRTAEGYRADIMPEQKAHADGSNAQCAVFGGFFCILEDTVPADFAYHGKDARCAVGVAGGGSVLYVLSVEKGAGSAGLSYPQCARILAQAGCDSAMEFDGGSSAALYLRRRDGKEIYVGHPLVFPASSIGFSLTNE